MNNTAFCVIDCSFEGLLVSAGRNGAANDPLLKFAEHVRELAANTGLQVVDDVINFVERAFNSNDTTKLEEES